VGHLAKDCSGKKVSPPTSLKGKELGRKKRKRSLFFVIIVVVKAIHPGNVLVMLCSVGQRVVWRHQPYLGALKNRVWFV